MTSVAFDGRSVVVVGASSGIGRALASRALQAGASVALVARRAERLAAVIDEAGRGIAIRADLRQRDDCSALGARVGEALGPIDLVVFCSGAAMLQWVEASTHADWTLAMETNVIGVNLAIASLVPRLAPGALVAALSSEAVGSPRRGLAAYSASKAALEQSLRAWRHEHPEIRFGCITVGATMPTGFGDAFDPDILTTALDSWADAGQVVAGAMHTDEVAAMLAGTLALALQFPTIGLEQLTLRPAGTLI